MSQIAGVDVAALVGVGTGLDDDVEGMLAGSGRRVLQQHLGRVGRAGLRGTGRQGEMPIADRVVGDAFADLAVGVGKTALQGDLRRLDRAGRHTT